MEAIEGMIRHIGPAIGRIRQVVDSAICAELDGDFADLAEGGGDGR